MTLQRDATAPCAACGPQDRRPQSDACCLQNILFAEQPVAVVVLNLESKELVLCPDAFPYLAALVGRG